MSQSERPSRAWTDNDPEFANRIGRIAAVLMYASEADLPSGTDPLDVAAARLWLKWTFDDADNVGA